MTTPPPTQKRGRGRPRRTDDDRAQARSILVEGALEAIRAEGPDISIETFAARLGVGRSTIYDHFGSKTGIADAIALHFVDQFDDVVAARLSTDDPGLGDDLLADAVRFLVELIDREPDFHRFSVRALQTSGASFLDNGLARAFRDRTPQIEFLLPPGTAPASARMLVDGMFGLLFAAIESWQASGEPDRETVIATLTSAVLALLAAPPHGRSPSTQVR